METVEVTGPALSESVSVLVKLDVCWPLELAASGVEVTEAGRLPEVDSDPLETEAAVETSVVVAEWTVHGQSVMVTVSPLVAVYVPPLVVMVVSLGHTVMSVDTTERADVIVEASLVRVSGVEVTEFLVELLLVDDSPLVTTLVDSDSTPEVTVQGQFVIVKVSPLVAV